MTAYLTYKELEELFETPKTVEYTNLGLPGDISIFRYGKYIYKINALVENADNTLTVTFVRLKTAGNDTTEIVPVPTIVTPVVSDSNTPVTVVEPVTTPTTEPETLPPPPTPVSPIANPNSVFPPV